jgi:signal transduction histidine kinase
MARPGPPTRRRDSLATRLFAAQALIVIAGATTLVIVAVVTAPGLYRAHLQRAAGPLPPELARHLDQALAEALLLSLAVAVAAALATSLAVSWFITRRLTRPIAAMADAATRIADGDYDTRVPASRLGVEFTLLDNAFNRMAAALHGTERRRRELLADLAHELRTPVATLDSFLEGIEDDVIPSNLDTWRTMRQQTARLRRLVEDVDSVSRAEERQLQVDPQPVNVDELVAEAVQAAATAFRDQGVVVRHQPCPAPAQVRGDPDRLREILDNLLSNALRHTATGDVVTVTTTSDRTRIVVRVADTGEGIAAEHLPHLFDRFYRTDAARRHTTGGSGIGLTIARALAHAHGGDLGVASDGPGHGATFTLTLPVAPTRWPLPRRLAAPVLVPRQQPKTRHIRGARGQGPGAS